MFREYAFKVSAVRFPTISLAGILRITGEIVPGAKVMVQARAVKTGSYIPDKWTSFSNAKEAVLGPNLDVSHSIESGGWKVSGTVYLAPGLDTLHGTGEASWGFLSSDLSVVGIKTLENLQPEAPDISPPGEPIAGKWTADEFASYSKDYKIKSIISVPRGTLLTTYNRYTRQHSFIDEYVNDNRVKVWEASKAKGQSAETIGGGVRLGNTVFFIPEVGKNVLLYDVKSGVVTKGSALNSDHEFSVEMCLHAGKVVFGGANQGGSNTGIYDAGTSKKLFDSPRKGLIPALASDGDVLWWVVVGDGVCNSKGGSWSLKASSIAIWNGSPVVGSQVDGSIYRFSGYGWNLLRKVEASKINRLIVDPRDNCLLVSAANPDTFLRIFPSGETETLGRWADQPVAVSGEQFDTYINVGPGDTILGSRALENGCRAYRFSRVGSKPPPNVTPEKPEPPTSGAPTPNKGGDGLYKPYEYENGKVSSHSKLWLLPGGIKAEHVSAAGEFRPDGTHVRWFSWPDSPGTFGTDSQKMDGNNITWSGAPEAYYHNSRLKCRQAKASAAGNVFKCIGRNGLVLAQMTIVNPEVRQEGRS